MGTYSQGGKDLKVAIVGSSGYIAEFILQRFEKEKEIESALRIDRNANADIYLDLEEAEKFDYAILDNIDFVVFTAAISGPDKCAQDFNECWKINVIGTSYFIREAIRRKCKVLFFSSDAVFGNDQKKIYDELSPTEAQTPYGRMKKAVEDEFRNESRFKAIRLSYVASAKDRFITYCLNCMKNKEFANVFHPFYRNVIVVTDVVEVVIFFALHWDEYAPTFLNVAGKELVSRVRMIDEMNRLFDGRLKYTISMPGEEFFSNRSRITQMKSLYMLKYKILPDNTFTEKISNELEDISL